MKKIAKSSHKRKVCVVTSSRADYGILKRTLRKILLSDFLELQLVVTGTHLSEKHGFTLSEIKEDGFIVSKFIPLGIQDDSAASISSYMVKAQAGFSEFFSESRPDFLLLLGDRYEVLAAAISALFEKIPVCHLHGGEITQGAFDDSLRHCISKLSHVHFVSHESYGKRLIQMGETPNSVINIGSLGVEAVKSIPLLGKSETEACLGIKLMPKTLVITNHPETLSKVDNIIQLTELLNALEKLEDTLLLFTISNADTNFEKFHSEIKNFISNNKKFRFLCNSMGQTLFFSTVKYSSGVLGNSSSGIIEVPSLKVGSINIGQRQKGRIQAKSVINCGYSQKEIISAVNTLFSSQFQQHIKNVDNPYEKLQSSDILIKNLEEINEIELQKQFHDICIGTELGRQTSSF
jgi:GDP/UDP-N,N'-diacetylbacillosamine 2-epimerase (hydrolysing)